jgi:D-alanine-D-alanine ligase
MAPDMSERYTPQAVSFEKVAVLMGGRSAEREVSLKTGAAVLKALKEKGYEAIGIDAEGEVWRKLDESKPTVVFLALHGRYGEDGTVQGLLELMDIPYTGSGVMASALAMDKVTAKAVLNARGIPVPIDYALDGGAASYPVIVKPSREGSTIGITIVKKREELAAAVREALGYDDHVMVEEFVAGRLLTVGVAGNPAEPLPVVEIRAAGGFYDYDAKYLSEQTEYICPAELSVKQTAHLAAMAVAAHDALDCRDISRSDFIMREDGSFVCLEINTMPGMTETSLVPKAAAAAGIPFEDLVEKILRGASLKQKPGG